jgi:chitodextrinase
MRDAASENLNNVTATKQSVNSASGLVVLASNDVTKRYWHADVVPGSGGTTPPPADSTAPSVPSGVTATANSATSVTVNWNASTDDTAVVSYQVKRGGTVVADAVSGTSFTDTGLTASTQYSYTVSAVDAAGNRSADSAAATVTTPSGGTTPPPPSGGISVVDSTTAGNSAAVTSVTIAKPAGVAAGDVLVAQITADANPSISTAPTGWSTAISPRSVGTSARLFAYYHVVGSGDPSSYTWTLSTAVKWNAGIAAFRGVDTSTVWDSAAQGATNTTAASSLAVPAATTVTPGAVVVGGVALNSGSVGVTAPSNWTERLEATGVQVTEVASQPRPTAGSTGTATWTYSSTATSAGWLRALKPAA